MNPTRPPVERLKTLLLTALVPPLAGRPFGDWLRAMRANDFDVDPAYWPRAGLNAVCSSLTTLMKRREERRYGPGGDAPVPPPVFVLGHYRSGTTHLHNLLSTDTRFAFPTMFRLYNPHTFRVFEPLGEPLAAAILPRKRLVDGMAWGTDMPQEDELGLMMLTCMSPYMGFVFPRRWDQFQRYLSFRGVPDADVCRWQSAVRWFLAKLTGVDGRPLLLKSPPHTARIRLLLELFPGARFVHIHRDPYAVFRSTRQLFERITAMFSFQRVRPDRFPQRVLDHYRTMYEAFFEERPLIPAGRFSEVRFADLESNPLEQVERIYGELGLPDFAAARPAVRDYVATLRGYRKNEYPPLADEWRERIASEWRQSFEAWRYSK
jgi:hypothetical protein